MHGTAPDEDLGLARAVAAGERHAFEIMIRRFNRMLYRVARGIVKDDCDAEDVLQTSYLHAYRDMDKYRGAARLSTWLVRIVINQALVCLRRRKRCPEVVTLSEEAWNAAAESGAVWTHARPETPEQAVLRSELRGMLEAAIKGLPQPRRSVFILRALEERSVADTARALGIPEATVRTRFFRARVQLSAALAPDGRNRTERCTSKRAQPAGGAV